MRTPPGLFGGPRAPLYAGCAAGGPATADDSLKSNAVHAGQPPRSSVHVDSELRLRAQLGRGLGASLVGVGDQQRGVLHRIRLGANFASGNVDARVELQSSGAFGSAGPGDDPMQVGLQQGWMRWRPEQWTFLAVEAGRMALHYGAGRQIGSFDFHQTGHAYDGIRLRATVDKALVVDVLSVRLRRDIAPHRACIGALLAGLAADQLYHRLSRALPLQIPKRGVEPGERPAAIAARILVLAPFDQADQAGNVFRSGTKRPGGNLPVQHLRSNVGIVGGGLPKPHRAVFCRQSDEADELVAEGLKSGDASHEFDKPRRSEDKRPAMIPTAP